VGRHVAGAVEDRDLVRGARLRGDRLADAIVVPVAVVESGGRSLGDRSLVSGTERIRVDTTESVTVQMRQGAANSRSGGAR